MSYSPMRTVKSKTPTQKPDQHHIAIYFGRFSIISKTFHRVQGIERELSADISTLLYFHQYEDSYQISAEPDMSQSKQSLQFNPFFDLELDNLFIGDEENQTEVELEEIVQVLAEHILNKVLPAKNPFVDVVFTSFSEQPRFVQAVETAIEQTLSKRSDKRSVHHLAKAAVLSGSATFTFMQNRTAVNGQQILIGYKDFHCHIVEAARAQFGERIFKSFVRKFLIQHSDQNWSESPVTIKIPPEVITILKRDNLLPDLLSHKRRLASFFVKASQQNIDLIISIECIKLASIALIDQVLAVAQVSKAIEEQQGLPQLQPKIIVFEEGINCMDQKVFQTHFEERIGKKYAIKVFGGKQLLDMSLQKLQDGSLFQKQQIPNPPKKGLKLISKTERLQQSQKLEESLNEGQNNADQDHEEQNNIKNDDADDM